MTLEIVYGESRNRPAAQALAEALKNSVESGTVYLGYPVLATADERVEVDALLVSQAHGLVAFLIADDLPSSAADREAAIAEQDRLFGVLESYLSRHEGLRERRKLAVQPNTATLFGSPPPAELVAEAEDGFYGQLDDLGDWLADLEPISADLEHRVSAALQRVTTIKPAKKRTTVSKPSSRGGVLKEIEKGIANLDRWQKQAAIESPEGPQRIRGLAGSGKTVVLALKAAYWHTTHPDWTIALTFHSRALYQQIDDLVTRFTFEHGNEPPDPERLRIVHSWGSSARAGVYSMIATALGETPRDWSYARGKYGMDDAFQGICRELLTTAQTKTVTPIFDAVLIDEAQDLPPEFFQLVYLFTKDPKRIVWGYDELQRLSDEAMPSTVELFGTGPQGEQLVSLESTPGGPRRDIVLQVCYRNTPWALATAHALGIGVNRPGGLLQHPDEPQLWSDIGYEVVSGELSEGEPVQLRRAATSYPSYFNTLLQPADAVMVQTFDDEAAQDAWIADQIAININEDELEHDDILVVLPDTYRAKSRAPRLMKELTRRGIPSHLAGVNTSTDTIFRPESVALAHIFRAKGNEAPMVYAIDSQYAASEFNAVSRRNKLFTAITRSRAWVRITGYGEKMEEVIAAEAAAVRDNDYKLSFTIPTGAALAKLRHIHRDRPEGEEATVKKATAGVAAFLEAVERGEMDLYDLPPDIRTRLTRLRGSTGDDDGNE
ncbi:superfamily I DNA and RNA helicase [Marmoricola sp. OAE513]|uniref:DEAD/DEAH box helicase n=1 Tax=Marmoricola sp. OAE513 TaxID=2817894 RepID=UPI001AE8EDD0